MTLEQFFEQFRGKVAYAKLVNGNFQYATGITIPQLATIHRVLGYEIKMPLPKINKGFYWSNIKINKENNYVNIPYNYVMWVYHDETVSCVFSHKRLKSWFVNLLLKNIGAR